MSTAGEELAGQKAILLSRYRTAAVMCTSVQDEINKLETRLGKLRAALAEHKGEKERSFAEYNSFMAKHGEL